MFPRLPLFVTRHRLHRQGHTDADTDTDTDTDTYTHVPAYVRLRLQRGLSVMMSSRNGKQKVAVGLRASGGEARWKASPPTGFVDWLPAYFSQTQGSRSIDDVCTAQESGAPTYVGRELVSGGDDTR